jgi:hypothetical protein
MCSLLAETVGRGGAMKNCRCACYCCNINRDDIAKPNNKLYDDCIEEDSIQCYHQEISDKALIEWLHAETQDFIQKWPHLVSLPFKESCIRIVSNEVNGDCTRDCRHIEFIPRNHLEEIKCTVLLQKEQRIRSNNIEGILLDVLWMNLNELLLIEERRKLVSEVLAANTLEEAMVHFEKAVPCLLHVENRGSE